MDPALFHKRYIGRRCKGIKDDIGRIGSPDSGAKRIKDSLSNKFNHKEKIMKNWKFTLITLLIVLVQVLAAWPPAATATEAAAPAEPTAVPTATVPPEPVDIILWAQATV